MFDVLFFFLLNLKEREDPLIVPTFALHTSFSNYACIMEVCGISNVRSFLIFVYEINEYAGWATFDQQVYGNEYRWAVYKRWMG